MSRFEAVSVMDSRCFTEESCLGLLTENERHHYSSMPNRQRKTAWVGGRVVAKHLFLDRLSRTGEEGSCRWIRGVEWLNSTTIQEFPAWAYREVEIMPRVGAVGCPMITWSGKAHPVRVSLAHTSNLFAACLDGVKPVGLDVEVSVPRARAFYYSNFSWAERSWVESFSQFGTRCVDRAYTLLWCLKESVIKSQRSDEISIWHLPRIHVQLLCGTGVVAEALCSGIGIGPVLLSEVEVQLDKQTRTAEVALTSSRDEILTVLRFSRDLL